MPDTPTPDELRVLVYARTWGPDLAIPAARRALREHVRALRVEVTIHSEGGVWSFHPDDSNVRFGAYTDHLLGDLATAATLLARRPAGTDVFVISAGTIHRVPGGTTPLPEALALARPLVEQCRTARGEPRPTAPERLLDLTGHPSFDVGIDVDVDDDVWPRRASGRSACTPLALESPPS